MRRFLEWHLPSKRVVRGRSDRHGLRRGEAGAALVELAVALPLLAIILVGTIDFGRAFRTAMIVTNAARAGAQYGAQSLTNSGDPLGMVNQATSVLTANGLATGATPTALRSCQCASDLAVIPGVVACTSTCPNTQHLVVSVTVTAVRTFSMVNPFPGLPSNLTITRDASMRVMP